MASSSMDDRTRRKPREQQAILDSDARAFVDVLPAGVDRLGRDVL